MERFLSVISGKVPNLIKGIIASVFSEDAGREMGKAVGAFYKSLVESGIPEQTALKMAENYLSTFTSLGEIVKRIGAGEERRKEESRPKEEQFIEILLKRNIRDIFRRSLITLPLKAAPQTKIKSKIRLHKTT